MTAPTVACQDHFWLTSSDDDELDHLYCCDPETALCGADLSDAEDGDDDEDELPCVVCEDLDENQPFCSDTCPGVEMTA